MSSEFRWKHSATSGTDCEGEISDNQQVVKSGADQRRTAKHAALRPLPSLELTSKWDSGVEYFFLKFIDILQISCSSNNI